MIVCCIERGLVVDMIIYDRLWQTMKEKGVSQYDLIVKYGVSSSLINRLRHNQGVSIYSIDVLCNIEDIVEHVKE